MDGKVAMKIETIGFFGGDARMTRLAQMLAQDGYTIKAWSLPELPDAGKPSDAAEADRVVLPVPLQRDGRLYGTSLPLDELWRRLRPDVPVYAGAVGEKERAGAEARGLRLTDYFADEALAVRNAVPTAEGAAMLAMERMSVTLRDAPCLVIGFGRVGKLLAHTLGALGARLAVSARQSGDLAWIEALGWRGVHTRRLAGKLGGFRAVFNTVPCMVLDAPLLRELRRDCLLVELASQPGIDAEAAQALGLTYVKAGGLPGKVAPETAAHALRRALYRIWKEEGA